MLEVAPDAICASPYGLGSDRVRTPSTVNALPGSRPVEAVGLDPSRGLLPGASCARLLGERPERRGEVWRVVLQRVTQVLLAEDGELSFELGGALT